MNHPSPLHKSAFPAKTLGAGLRRKITGIARETQPSALAYVRMLLANKWLFLWITVALAVPAVAVIYKLTPIYRATATVLVEVSKSKVVSIDDVAVGPSANREYFQTQAEFLKSRDVALRVIRDLKLTEHPAFDPRQARTGPMAKLGSMLGPSGPDFDEEAADAGTARESYALSRLQRGLDISPIRLSQLVQVSFESPDPVLSGKIANAIAESYIRSDLDARLRTTQTALAWLSEQLESLRKKVEVAERRLQEQRDTSGLVSSRVIAVAEGGNAKQLEEYSQRLVAARVSRAQIEQVYLQLRPGAPNRYEVPAVFNNPAVAKAREAEALAERKLAEMRDRVGPAHPMYQSAQAEFDAAKNDRNRQSDAVIASVEREYEAAKSAERTIEASVSRSRGAIQDINRKQIEVDALEREATTDRQLYQTFLARVKETAATADFRNPVARIIDPAITPSTPAKPPKKELAVLAVLLSMLIAGLVTIVRERQRSVIRASDEVESMLNVPLLTVIPKVEGPEGSNLSRMQHGDKQSFFAESVRTASTGVQLSMLEIERPIIAISSSVPGEGKSTLVANFAIENARTRRVLLIDADLRRPKVAMLLGIPPRSPGLTNLIKGAPLEKCIHHIPELNLNVLPCGESLENPLDLIASPRFPQALNGLRQSYDMIVIDTPPVELVSDALLIARLADGLIYVVKAGETPVAMIQRGLDRIQGTGVTLLGVALNSHDFEKAGRYYGDTSAHTRYSYQTRPAA
jgi:Mrp family chromosome partitioning ATPase